MTAVNSNLDPGELLTEEQLALKGSFSRRTLQGWRTQGKGPRFVKLGRLVRYRAADVHEWLEANAARSTAEIDAKSS
jgi:predicted DNA-binding transcriptional regulator AlpA